MSDQSDTPVDAQLVQLSELLDELSTTMRERDSQAALLDSITQLIRQVASPSITALANKEERLKEEIRNLAVPLMRERHVRSFVLDSGTMELGPVREAVEIDDEKAVLKRIRRAGLLRLLTKRRYTILKEKIKEHWGRAQDIRGIRIVERQNLLIRPAHQQGELEVRQAEIPLRVPLKD